MIKRVNFTGRRRVPRERVNVAVYDGHPRVFDAELDLSGMDLPPHAAVVLEATCAGSTVVRRYRFGEVAAVAAPHDRLLADLNGQNVLFTLKVIDQSERIGRILGIAENVRPVKVEAQTTAGRRGILPIERADLGQQIWRLEFKEQDVFLLVNASVPGLVDRAGSDPIFYASVYPQVVRQILHRAFEEGADVDDESDRWPVHWLRFGQHLHARRQRPPVGEEDEDAQAEWVEEVVEAFCQRHHLADRFRAAAGTAEGGPS